MNRASLIFVTVAAAMIGVAACSSPPGARLGVSNVSPNVSPAVIGGDGWTARMGWRYVSYIENDLPLTLTIEPMVKGADRVYVPDDASWTKDAPVWARGRRAEILDRLKSVAWNRKVSWPECECPFAGVSPDNPVPGSLESTPGGRGLENQRMFEPGSEVTHEQAHEIWHEAARIFAEQLKGEVAIFTGGSNLIPGSVFEAIELPALKKNPNVTLVFK